MPRGRPPSPATSPVALEERRHRYAVEKAQGRRQLNGAMRLRKLSTRALSVIALHIEGATGTEIARRLGVAPGTVYRILTDPLATPLLEAARSETAMRMRGLYPKAVDRLREALDSPNPRIRVNAVEQVLRALGKLPGPAKPR